MISFLEHHQIFLTKEITPEVAEDFIRRLTLLTIHHHNDVEKRAVTVWLGAPGGHEFAVLSMIDVVRTSVLPLQVVGHGLVGSGAVWLFAAFPKGSRIALPHTYFLLHEGDVTIQGTRQESRAAFSTLEQLNTLYIDLLAEFTGQKKSTIRKILQTDSYLTAEQAQKLGIVDHIISWDEERGEICPRSRSKSINC
ncbi:MAG: ATP-dependent Clp protease proteolytic subunit [Nitrososphaerota archaeon]